MNQGFRFSKAQQTSMAVTANRQMLQGASSWVGSGYQADLYVSPTPHRPWTAVHNARFDLPYVGRSSFARLLAGVILM